MSSDHDWPVEVWAKLAEERRKDPRNRVIELVRYGKLSRERAEAWARERGLGPFESRPASGKHDPMAEMDWTLAMATAWIVWRKPQSVRECMEAYAAECSIWDPCDHLRASRRGPARPYPMHGHDLKTPNTPTPRDVLDRALIDKAFGSVPLVEPDQAKQELREALRRGDLVARGGLQAEPIERHRWIVLSPFTRAQHGGPHDAVYGEDGEVQFSRVTVERDAVLTTWRAPTTAAKVGRPKGSGNLSAADKPLAEEALKRIASGETRARVLADVASRALGVGELESKMKRIERRIKQLGERNSPS